MFKNIMFSSLFILISIFSLKQNLNAKTWERRNTTVYADSIIAAIERAEDIMIDSCEILGPLKIEGTLQKTDTITCRFSIDGSTFHDEVTFDRCCFMRWVTFQHSTFRAQVNFRRITFNMHAYFSYSNFEEGVDLMWCIFKKDGIFSAATFEKWLDFRGTSFNREANFVFTGFNKWVDFKEVVFGGNVSLSPEDFIHIERLSWKQLEGHLNYNSEKNYNLMKHFEDKRQLDDADGVYLFLKKHETFELKWYKPTKYWGYLMWMTCGYGVMPEYTILWSIGIVILFAFFYTLRFNSIKEIEKESRSPRRPRILREVRTSLRKRSYDALYFSIHTFIIGVVSDWHPTDEFLIKTKRIRLIKFRTLSMFEGVLGWVLLVLFVVTLTRKFIR